MYDRQICFLFFFQFWLSVNLWSLSQPGVPVITAHLQMRELLPNEKIRTHANAASETPDGER